MRAFISYSHFDENHLNHLHKHLRQLQRDGIISTWTDNEIPAGGKIDDVVIETLKNTDLFIALLSPDYINSNYCYEKEFEKALKMQEREEIIIVPIIAEPCDWLNTPFQKFKALPKDGKPISEWSNTNTAYLNIIQNLRSLLSGPDQNQSLQPGNKKAPSRNYKIQKDFDSIQKMDFLEETFDKIKIHLKENIQELDFLDNIQAKVTVEEKNKFEAILVNRNKINSESLLLITTDEKSAIPRINFNNPAYIISYSTGEDRPRHLKNTFSLANDEYDLFWENNSEYSFSYGQNKERFSAKDIVDEIWNEWLKSVGIEF
ncbi:TIR domain-containing protein [Salegentibacter sp. 24]|uniref:toll/interleukin-1 receptor domain-containing protein n=1 Tax=Salegentibacter sp. 24 TaxID=2183986 RepID=UPI0010604946|nr:toll/interleukin-1 receptor domain-containing protein [Salegentibacter sp. 24]TDN87104.1 TIR domain-containing protein [Salegentibacter sp. 24]